MMDYDIADAFKRIEDELIASMIRNMDRHRAQETKEGIEWSQWQAEQLKALQRFKVHNRKRYTGQFSDINEKIENLIQQARITGNMEQETEILQSIRKGFKGYKRASGGVQAEFLRLNDRKLEALIKATRQDMEKAETAVLRMADDQYRKTIFNAQVYANSGAGTYEQAVDMATKDMLSSGLNCVEYKNGARHTLADYADMAVRTANKRAYLMGEGEKRRGWGVTTVIINKRGNPCPKCLPFVGKVLIDDVWSGGKASDGPYPLMSTAIAAGLYHPRCKDSHTTYFPGISTANDSWTKEELEEVEKYNSQVADRQNAKRQAEKFERLEKYSIYSDNKKTYRNRQLEWKIREYRVTNEDGTFPAVKDRMNLRKEIGGLPQKVRNVLRTVDFRLNSSVGSGYDPAGNVIYLSADTTRRERMHEIGHALESSLFDSRKVTDLKKKITRGLTKNDIIIKTAYDSSGSKHQIFILNSDKFIDDYQSRLYVDSVGEAVNPDGTINTDVLGEFISVAVQHYLTYPQSLKKAYPEFYTLVEEAIN